MIKYKKIAIVLASMSAASSAAYAGSHSEGIDRRATSSFTGMTSAASTVEPIKGSITYERPDAVRFTKAPAGSPLGHEFYADGGKYKEMYVVQPNGSLKLVSRWRTSDS